MIAWQVSWKGNILGGRIRRGHPPKLRFRDLAFGHSLEEDCGRMWRGCFGDTELPVAKSTLRGVGSGGLERWARGPAADSARGFNCSRPTAFRWLEVLGLILRCSRLAPSHKAESKFSCSDQTQTKSPEPHPLSRQTGPSPESGPTSVRTGGAGVGLRSSGTPPRTS